MGRDVGAGPTMFPNHRARLPSDGRPARTRRAGLRFWPVVLLAFGIAAGPSWTVGAEKSALSARIDSILADEMPGGARVGVHVVALGTGRVLYHHRAMEKFIAASNQKLVTAAVALSELGQGYEFITRLYVAGQMREGVLGGEVILRGGGDPTLGSRHHHQQQQSALEVFGEWARALKAMGVVRVEGDLVADDSFFDRRLLHPDWSPRLAWKPYSAPVSALSVNDNCVRIICKPGAEEGAAAILSVEPDVGVLSLRNLLKTSATRHVIWFHREPRSSVVSVGGHILKGSQGFVGGVTVPHPALYAAALLREALHREGIQVTGQERLVTQRDLAGRDRWRLVAERRTDLLPVLRVMLKRSVNLYAEQVIKTVGAETGGEGSWEEGLARAEELLRALGFSGEEFDLADGSGLAHANRLPPALLTALLVHMDRSEYGETFRELLPVCGVDGTLRSRLTQEPYRGAVRAKTGSLSGVSALSGYADTKGGIRVAFSILINDGRGVGNARQMRRVQDAICRALVDEE